MGFLDKLKNVANMASEQLAKANAEKEKQILIDSLDRLASVKGKNIPEKAEFCLDKENKRIIIRTGIINNHHNLICEYNLDDVILFKLIECSQSDFGAYISCHSYLNIALNSGDELKLCSIVSKYADSDDNEINKKRETKDNEKVLDIILAFANKIQDNETIKWANDLLEANGYSDLLQYFD